MATTAKHRRRAVWTEPVTAAAAPADEAEVKQRGSPLYGVAEDESPDEPRDGTAAAHQSCDIGTLSPMELAAAHQSCELGTLSPMELQVYYDQLDVDRPAILQRILKAKQKENKWKVGQAERTAMGYCKHERCVATQTEDQTTQTKGMRKHMGKDNWQPAVAGVKAKGNNTVITKGKRKHVGMSKDKGKGNDNVTEGSDEERRAFLEAFERDEACRKRDDAIQAACLAYDSDYSDADTL